MTTYTAIPDADIDANSPVTATLMTLMRDNPIAITEKAAGAPVLANGYIVEAMYGASSVDQTAMKIASSSQSSSIGAGGSTTITGPGGTYQIAAEGYGTSMTVSHTGQSVAGRWAFTNSSAYTTNTAYLNTRYIQGSPPYETIDGDIPLFVYVAREIGTGNIMGVSVSTDPMWANHGPTNIHGRLLKDGRYIRKVPLIETEYPEGAVGVARAKRDALIMNDSKAYNTLVQRMNNDKMVEIEIDWKYKNRDWDIMPHPWAGNNLKGKPERQGPNNRTFPSIAGWEIALLNPQETLPLLDLHNSGVSVLEMVESNIIKVGNTPLKRSLPKGVKAYDFSF